MAGSKSQLEVLQSFDVSFCRGELEGEGSQVSVKEAEAVEGEQPEVQPPEQEQKEAEEESPQERKVSVVSEKKEDGSMMGDETASRMSKVDEDILESAKSSRSPSRFSEQLVEDAKINQFPDQEDVVSRDTRISSVKEDFGKSVDESHKEDKLEDKYLMEDLERLRVSNLSLVGFDRDLCCSSPSKMP
jgi:hypothetical protein